MIDALIHNSQTSQIALLDCNETLEDFVLVNIFQNCVLRLQQTKMVADDNDENLGEKIINIFCNCLAN